MRRRRQPLDMERHRELASTVWAAERAAGELHALTMQHFKVSSPQVRGAGAMVDAARKVRFALEGELPDEHAAIPLYLRDEVQP